MPCLLDYVSTADSIWQYTSRLLLPSVRSVHHIYWPTCSRLSTFLQGEVATLRDIKNSLVEEKAVLQGSLSSLQDQVGGLRQNVLNAEASCTCSRLTCMSCTTQHMSCSWVLSYSMATKQASVHWLVFATSMRATAQPANCSKVIGSAIIMVAIEQS